ncbi:MAG: hypothetical protein SVY10_09325 [Thermodesulfobacteriota bacterium]|nr:hypothetical protein [Thermodesulfobacteriota bacterium]
MNHQRYYQIGDMNIQLDSDIPMDETTFHPKFRYFEMDQPGEDPIVIKHSFFLPDLSGWDIGEEIYKKPPWTIYKNETSWTYMNTSGNKIFLPMLQSWSEAWTHLRSRRCKPYFKSEQTSNTYSHIARYKCSDLLAISNCDHTKIRIFSKKEKLFRKGNLHSLTLFPTDQIILARVVADREGCYLHASGVTFDDKGLLFVGHSDAGKSTMVMMLKNKTQVLCDDRVIVRKWPEGFRIYGTWSHGDVPDVSSSSAPLKAIFFLEKASENRLKLLEDQKEITRKLLSCLIKPLATADWWNKILILVEEMIREVPCYSLRFDKSGEVTDVFKDL